MFGCFRGWDRRGADRHEMSVAMRLFSQRDYETRPFELGLRQRNLVVLAMLVTAMLLVGVPASAVPNPPADSDACHDGSAPAPGPPTSNEYEVADLRPPSPIANSQVRGGTQGYTSTKYTVYSDLCVRAEVMGIEAYDGYMSNRGNQQDGDRSLVENFSYQRTAAGDVCVGSASNPNGQTLTDMRCPTRS